MPAPTGFTLVTASKIQDGSGRVLVSGRVTFFPVNGQGQSISAIAGGGGVIIATGVSFLVVNGAITTDLYGNTPQIADSSLTTPVNLLYRVTITDATGSEVQGPGYGMVQPSGLTFSLDNMVPNQPALAVVQTGPPGGSLSGFSQDLSASANGMNRVFVVASPPSVLWLYLNGVFQTPGVDYTLSGSTITCTVPPPRGELLHAQGISGTPGFSQDLTAGVDGKNTTFLLAVTPTVLWLYLDGVFQSPGVDYTLTGNSINYFLAPPTGDPLYAQGIY